jgi:AAA+ superfamily predicted ATPase
MAIENLLMEVDTNISLDSVILSDINKQKIRDFLRETECRDKLLAYRLQPMNRLLFYGDSGCGKTYLSKALSNYLHYQMLYIDIANAISSGSVAENISEVFKYANSKGNCIIFLDECDSIAWNRDTDKNSDGGTIRRATNSLFQQMDQMNPNNVIISATNMLYRLDAAFERRFNQKLEFRRPKQALDAIIDKFLFKDLGFKIAHDLSPVTKSVVEKKMCTSYYEIQGVVERAMKDAVMSDTLLISETYIYKKLVEVMDIKVEFKTDRPDEKESFTLPRYRDE